MSGVSSPILFYDGECGLCTAGIRFILRHDRRGRLRFASLRGAHAEPLRLRHPELHGLDSMVWVEPARDGHPERIRVRSDAGLAVADYLGGWWRLFGILGVIPRFIRDRLYDWIARNRGGILRRGAACTVPSPAERERFLDPA